MFDCVSKIPYYVATSVYAPLFAAEVKGADQYTLGAMATGLALTPPSVLTPHGPAGRHDGQEEGDIHDNVNLLPTTPNS